MAQGSDSGGNRCLSRLFGWWYLCVGLGFALLAIRNWLVHSALWAVAIRFVIAAGFLLLAVPMFRAARRGARRSGN
ncbi:MAG: hypothetical protein P4K98_09485 [Bryobacteraceae bacterium]|nr:hypothetical protein [Bryobacteraceae bacterium]